MTLDPAALKIAQEIGSEAGRLSADVILSCRLVDRLGSKSLGTALLAAVIENLQREAGSRCSDSTPGGGDAD